MDEKEEREGIWAKYNLLSDEKKQDLLHFINLAQTRPEFTSELDALMEGHKSKGTHLEAEEITALVHKWWAVPDHFAGRTELRTAGEEK